MSNSSVQEVRDRIIQLAREIEDFSKSNVPPQTFFQEFLKRVVGAVGGRAGVIWLRSGSGRLEQFCELGLANTTFNESPNALAVNQKLLSEVISNGQACTYHPQETSAQLPTADMLVLAALQRNKEVVGVVQIFQRAETPKQARPGFLQFVEQMTGYACRYLDRQANGGAQPQGAAVNSVASEFEQFILELHKSLDHKEVATTAANDGRLLVGCDRLSVAVLDGKKTVIRAISGQESVNQRANLVRRMTTLASHVIRTGEKMEYTGKVDHLAPRVEEALADFIQESGSRMVTVIPVFQPEPLVEKEDDNARPREKIRVPVGGLIIEQIAESQPKPGVLEKGELIGDHVGSAIYNAKTYNRLFLMPLWRTLGKCFAFLEGRNGLKAALVVLALVLVVVALVFIPWDYRVEGEGRMVPVTQKDVFAPWDGEVVKIHVESGKRVEAGQLLIEIDNPDLSSQFTAMSGELDTKETQRRAIIAQKGRLSGPDRRDREEELDGQLAQTNDEIRSLTTQLTILRRRLESLDVKAPIPGIVTTFQIEQLLLNRPIRRGEVLLEIKDDAGPWRLELEIPEKRMGHLTDAQKAKREVGGSDQLDVEFVLATDAEDRFDGTLQAVAQRVNSSEEQGSIVIAFADFDVSTLPRQPRIGAEVRAKINCGEMSLGYVLFGDVVEFIQKYFWL